jgi:hypothetical protein
MKPVSRLNDDPYPDCFWGILTGYDAANALRLAEHQAGVKQIVGYTVTTWYGYAGWGCLDYFVKQPGRYTFAEAFLANEADLKPVITDNFILVPDPRECDPARNYRVVFRAKTRQ